MTEQDFKDAYTLLLSGAAKIVHDKGMEFKKDKFGNLYYILFPDFPLINKAIIKVYHKNNTKTEEIHYLNKRLHGKYYRWFYENGIKYREEEYYNGKLCGEVLGWYDDGNKRFKIEVKNGIQHGETIEWETNGNIKVIEKWKNGMLISKIKYHKLKHKKLAIFNKRSPV